MCKSVKGAAFFGSSIHVVASFVFLLWFLFDTVITEVHINLWRCVSPEDDPPKNYNVLVHYLNLPFKFLYYCCLCVTGIYIFRGVERNAPRVIKFALLVFVIVQVLGLAFFITISLNYWEDDEPSTIHVQALNSDMIANPNSQIHMDHAHIKVDKMPYTMLPEPDRLIGPENPNGHTDEYGEVVRQVNDEDGNYTIKIEVISHIPEDSRKIESGESVEFANDEEAKAVLESPLDPLILATSPMPPPPLPFPLPSKEDSTNGNKSADGGEEDKEQRESEMEPMSPEVVLVKVVKESKGLSSPRKLSHNQLVQLVMHVFLVGFNAVGSFIYTGILLIHLTSL